MARDDSPSTTDASSRDHDSERGTPTGDAGTPTDDADTTVSHTHVTSQPSSACPSTAPPSEQSSSPSPSHQSAAVRSRLSHGPLRASALLGLGGCVLAWRVVVLFGGPAAVTATPLGATSLAAACSLPLLAALALGRPARSTAVGLAGGLAGLLVTLGALAAPANLTRPYLLFAGLLAAGVGGVLAVGWRQGGPRVTLGRDGRLVRAGRTGLVVVLVGLVVLNGAPAVAGDTFPAQGDAYGGFVVSQDTLAAGYYDYDPDCGTIGAECPNLTIDSTSRDTVRVARQRLDNRNGNPVVIDNFLVYKNFYRESTGEYEHLEMRARSAVGTSGDGGRAVDAYISEFRSDYLVARLDVVGGIDLDPAVDEIAYWTCTPYDDEGWGTINDDRLGLSTDPRLTEGEDVTLLAHQLASSKTVLEDFTLTVERGRREDIETGESEPGDCA